MIRKRGYFLLLGITILFTLSAALVLIGSFVDMGRLSFHDQKPYFQLALMLVLLLCAGTTCVIRKRLFTLRK